MPLSLNQRLQARPCRLPRIARRGIAGPPNWHGLVPAQHPLPALLTRPSRLLYGTCSNPRQIRLPACHCTAESNTGRADVKADCLRSMLWTPGQLRVARGSFIYLMFACRPEACTATHLFHYRGYHSMRCCRVHLIIIISGKAT